MSELRSNSAAHAAELDLDHEAVPGDQRVEGDPQTGAVELTNFYGVEVGVWEMTPGVATDVEVDEVFIVLAGSATVEFGDGSPTLTVGPGDVVRLAAGAETTWTVTETLRKIYLTQA
ncbi:cupin domain-containing protein [Mycobacterium sp. 236(2023)]|uniref:cupin domain-containing protein n=1 Tax=Mycobacterium sp. 236(2023) TaxID=3038163 RepID=UPI0024152B62|nr:cupin domain-containing protein [Mycobacterium sp. 236(2023)]MDG4663021.1 cupin domain-containing protein [Mycobacterium sp. 236(2023)]